MKQYHSRHTAVLTTRGFYTILTVCALIIAASAWVLWSDATADPANETQASLPIVTPAETPDLSVDTPVLSEDDAAADEDAAETETEPEEAEQDEAEESDDTAAPAEPTPTETVNAPVYVRPVSGAVITPFSGDELLFQPTMGDWRVHNGTDFAAEAGETVMSLTDGTVQEVVEDGLYGTCVTVTHDADLTSTYRGLPETILNLPEIPGGKKLIYPHIQLELTAIEDFEELGRENEMFAKLAEICKANNNVWCEEAEKYLLNTMASNSCNGEGNRV